LNILRIIANIADDIQHMAFPNVCASCSTVVLSNEKAICSRCLLTLPFSFYYDDKNNALAKSFWGRVNLEFAVAHFIFKKDTIIQHLLHSIKYDNRKDAAVISGILIGKELKNLKAFADVDYIFPIPLHPAKKIKRGYNQSLYICNGISEITGVETTENFLVRVKDTSTQTKKKRYERWENMEYGFEIVDAELLKNKHILLVDDVVTTGATIEACSLQLQKIEGIKLSVASIAHAK
jgi:ComF family protein